LKIFLHIVTNDFSSDNRVLRSALASKSMGARAMVYALHRRRRGLPDKDRKEGVIIWRFRLKSLNWPRYLPIQLIKYLEAVLCMSRAGYKIKPNLIHANDLAGLIIGFVISKITKGNLLYDSHELQSETRGTLEYPKFLVKILLILERFLAKRSNSVITVSSGIAEEMSKRLNISKPEVIRNLPEYESLRTSNFNNPLRRAINLDLDTPIILFQGGISPGRGLMLLIDAMRKIKNTDATLVFLGNGVLVEKLREKANSFNLKNRIIFYPAVSSKILPQWTADATIGVHPMEGICLNHLLALPNKIFEYIQANIPVLVSDMPEMKRIIDHYGVGRTFEDGDAEDLALQIDYILNDPKLLNYYKLATMNAVKELNWKIEKQKLIEIYDKLT